MFFKAKGYHCIACDNEKSALDKVKNNASSVVLIDLKLPNVFGLEAMKKINSLYILNEIHYN